MGRPVIYLLSACLQLGATGEPPSTPARPNVVYLIADDQASGTLSCEGHPYLSTPNIDRIAREGARFENAFVTSSICSASRASFLTGRYARDHGVLHNRDTLREGVATFADLLTAAGWDSAFVGKWHLGKKSFDTIRGFGHTAVLPVQGRYQNAKFVVDGEAVKTEGYVDDRTTDFALEFLERERDGPFLLCVGFKAAHKPREPAARFAHLFEDATFGPPPSVSSLPPFPRRAEWRVLAERAGELLEEEAVPADWAETYGVRRSLVKFNESRDASAREYLRLIAGIDENVGRILDALDERDLARNTVVVYTSDHGYMQGEHGMGGKATAYEESMRTILLVRDPRFAARGDAPIHQLALNIDVAPTLLDLAGLEVPDAMQGRSLRPLLAGEADGWRTSFLYEFYRSPVYGGVPTTLAVREDRWKLITYPGYPEWSELFDLASDPHEMNNLAGDPEHADQLERLLGELAKLEEVAGERAE